MDIVFVRSSGPGGQNVNKRSTKAQLHWNVDHSAVLTAEQKGRLHERLESRINRNGEVVVECDEMRSQSQNRERAIFLLRTLVDAALTPEAERIPTEATSSSKERRLDAKERLSRKKQQRKKEDW